MVTMKPELQLFFELKIQAEELPYRDDGALDALRRRGDLLISKFFGEAHEYRLKMRRISLLPEGFRNGMSENDYKLPWELGKREFVHLIKTIIQEIQLSAIPNSQPPEKTLEAGNDSVFIVHGHDNDMKLAVARLLEKLGINPIILHEQPNRGQTMIEKLTDNASRAGFAIVLLSPDDIAKGIKETEDAFRTRPRQNVVFEMGFFIGLLGRSNVIALYKTKDFEILSDYQGVVYIPYDGNNWSFDIVKELKSAGFRVDANLLI